MTHVGTGAQEGDTSPTERGWTHSKLVFGEAYMEDTLLWIAAIFQQAVDTGLAKFQTRWLLSYLNLPTISIFWDREN